MSAALESAMTWLEKHATKATKDGMARYAIPSDHALGVSMSQLKVLAKQLGTDHDLAAELWDTGVYEARLLASLIDDPAKVTAAQMERWCNEFDNWGVADTVCFALFDRTQHAWKKVTAWAKRDEEFVKRAAFALLWGLTVHDKTSGDEPFIAALALIERAATDERHFVKKAVNMALRATGKRNVALNTAAIATAKRLAASADPAPKWIGKNALTELASPALKKRVAAKR